MSADAPNGGLLPWRVATLEKDLREEREARRRAVEKLDDDKADIKDLAALGKAVDSLSGKVDSLRTAIVTFAFVVAASAIAFAFAVLQIQHL